MVKEALLPPQLESAFGASPTDSTVDVATTLKHGSNPLFQAALADVVCGLRTKWIAGPAKSWALICMAREAARYDLDQRVATALYQGFSDFSQLLCHFEFRLMHSGELAGNTEKSMLEIEKLLIKFGDIRSTLIEVAQTDKSMSNFLSQLNAAIEGGDQAHIQSVLQKWIKKDIVA